MPMRCTSIPSTWAAWRFTAQARTALPSKVCSRKANSAPIDSAATAITHRRWRLSTAPHTRSGAPAENSGRERGVAPQAASASPRRAIAVPMVMMIKVTSVAPRAGRMVR